ncbi:hypothetical protein [uncultured Reyranella sp.]|nr:hypothetical protein [uncultured Reyranella sp.]
MMIAACQRALARFRSAMIERRAIMYRGERNLRPFRGFAPLNLM